MYPELQMQQTVASGLAAQTCQFDRPCTNLAWCSFPGEPLCAKWIHLNSPHKNLQDSSQRNIRDQDPSTTQLAGNLPKLNKKTSYKTNRRPLPERQSAVAHWLHYVRPLPNAFPTVAEKGRRTRRPLPIALSAVASGHCRKGDRQWPYIM